MTTPPDPPPPKSGPTRWCVVHGCEAGRGLCRCGPSEACSGFVLRHESEGTNADPRCRCGYPKSEHQPTPPPDEIERLSGHTPGPWVDDGVVIWAGPSGDIPVAMVPSRNHGMDPCPIAPENGLENAALIAAAPMLLAEVRSLRADLQRVERDRNAEKERARGYLISLEHSEAARDAARQERDAARRDRDLAEQGETEKLDRIDALEHDLAAARQERDRLLEPALKLAIAVRHAYDSDDRAAMRLFGTNAPQRFAWDVEHSPAALSSEAQPKGEKED